MLKRPGLAFATLLVVTALLAACGGSSDDDAAFIDQFNVDKSNLSSVGKNTYFVLEPGFQLVLESKDTHLAITVLNETKMVDGVETRIVEEKETVDGKLYEISLNYYAIDKTTNDVYYFGEDVDFYKDGVVINHEGAWLSGQEKAAFGLMMPGTIVLNSRYYQETAPDVALGRARYVSVSEKLTTPAGSFTDVLKVEESNPLEGSDKSTKFYAPNIGLARDGDLYLVKYGYIAANAN
jgi:hypothetical protein